MKNTSDHLEVERPERVDDEREDDVPRNQQVPDLPPEVQAQVLVVDRPINHGRVLAMHGKFGGDPRLNHPSFRA